MKRSQFLMALVLTATAGMTAAAGEGGGTNAATVASGTNTQVIA